MVPKVIHQIVLGDYTNKITDRCLKSWYILKEFEFTIEMWNSESIIIFLKEHYPFALDSFIEARNLAEASDIARYLIVYHFGGYYFDWDIELLDVNRFLSLIENHTKGFLVQDPVNHSIGSEAFSAQIFEPFLYLLVKSIVKIFNNGLRDLYDTPQYSGPYKMREVYQIMNEESRQILIKVKDVFLYDYWEIRNRPKRKIETPMVHYWLHSWMT